MELELENKKENPVKVFVKERMPGDWEIVQSSHDYEKVDARVISYEEMVPAGGMKKISYLVQYEL